MSVTISGFDATSGERVFDPTPGYEAANDAFREDLFATPEWIELQKKFDLESGIGVVNAVIDSIPGRKLMSQVQAVVKNIVLAGGLTRFGNLVPQIEQEPNIEPEPERDSRGHVLGESQKKWREFREFSETHSSEECRRRARVDSEYASFRRKNFEREARETPSTQFELAGQSQSSTAASTNKSHADLIAWAEEYLRTPMQEVRKLRNPVFNLNAEEYERNFHAALAAGLI